MKGSARPSIRPIPLGPPAHHRRRLPAGPFAAPLLHRTAPARSAAGAAVAPRWSSDGTPMTALLVLILLLSSAATAAAQRRPLSSPAELAALYSLRASLGLRGRDWPRKSDPCAAWFGVRCRDDGRVVGLDLAGLRRTRLGRQDPRFTVDGLRNLTLLASFNASGFPLPGAIPDWFGAGGVPPLAVLDLSSCSVVGAIPPAVGGLVNLTYLDLSGNSISGGIPDQLFAGLVSLSVLNFSGNRLTGAIPSSLPSAANLTVLNLAGNFLAGSIPAAVGTIVNLAVLNLSNNGLTGQVPAALGDLSRLRILDLRLNSLSGPLPADLAGLTSLQTLSLGRNLFAGGIPDGLFARLSRLQALDLARNGFSGELPAAIWRIPGLAVADLSGNNFTGGLPERSSSNALAFFNLSRNQLYGALELAELTGFGFIDLSDNYFQGIVPGARLNASLSNNCLQNQTNQKSFDVCRSFYAARGLVYDNGSTPPIGTPESTPTRRGRRSNRTWRYVLAGVLGGLGFILLIMLVMVLLLRRRRAGRSDQRGVDVQVPPPSAGGDGRGAHSPAALVSQVFPGDAYTYEQLLTATEEFNVKNLIKHGHSGDLYLGKLENGASVVIKRVEVDLVGKDGYMVELELFGRLSHARLVPFLGHCLEQENVKFLVYKYMPNGDLSSSFYRKTSAEEDGLQSLDWITRLKIALGVAEALFYLHHECNPPLVHRDIQASSILLDDKFEVRLGSLSEICPQEGDGHQSVVTRFLRLSQTADQGPSGSSSATCAYDVYCLGKVLLELVTGKLGISGSNDASVNEWLDQVLPYINIYKKDMLEKIVDPSLIVDEDLLQEVWAMAIVAKSCLNPKPSKRPLTKYVVKALENPLKIVREDNNNGGSARLRTASSRGSWSAVFFGSWRHSSSDMVAPGPPTINREGSNLRQVGRTGSHGSGKSGDFPSSHKRLSKEIFPEPSNPTIERGDAERSDDDNLRE